MNCLNPNLVIRDETDTDVVAIHDVTLAAFESMEISSHTEQYIIEALRAANALQISLVAELDGQVVGHIAFSPVKLSSGMPGWVGLGPVSVVPEHQRKGIGKALIETGLSRLKSLKAQGCCLVGHPEYYKKFGFQNPEGLVLEGVPKEVFFALSIHGSIPDAKVTFHNAFKAEGPPVAGGDCPDWNRGVYVMRTHVALLRGINVGGRATIPMKELALLFLTLGCENVQTYLRTGNLVFESSRDAGELEELFESAIAREFSLSIPVVVRSREQFANYLVNAPFHSESKSDPSHLLLYLSKSLPLDTAVGDLLVKAAAGESAKQAEDAIWIYFPDGIGRSKVTPSIVDRSIGSPATGRNWNTLLKISELFT